MRSYRAVLLRIVIAILIAISVPLSLESTPAPKVAVQAVIEYGKPPRGTTIEAGRDRMLAEVRAAVPYAIKQLLRLEKHHDVDFVIRTGKGKKFHFPKGLAPLIREQKGDLVDWVNKNLRIERLRDRFIRIQFDAGSKAERAAIINVIVATYYSKGQSSRRWQLEREKEYVRPRLSRDQQELAEESNPALIPQIIEDIQKTEAELERIDAELEMEPPEPVIHWAIE